MSELKFKIGDKVKPRLVADNSNQYGNYIINHPYCKILSFEEKDGEFTAEVKWSFDTNKLLLGLYNGMFFKCIAPYTFGYQIGSDNKIKDIYWLIETYNGNTLLVNQDGLQKFELTTKFFSLMSLALIENNLDRFIAKTLADKLYVPKLRTSSKTGINTEPKKETGMVIHGTRIAA